MAVHWIKSLFGKSKANQQIEASMPNYLTSARVVLYPYTNESLDAIVKGMDVNETDDIIAVGGSICQAAAMLEKAHSVTAVDDSKNQIEYAKERTAMLQEGNIEKFLQLDFRLLIGEDKINMEKSIAYFSEPGRLERIRQKLDKLKIKHADDILGEAKQGRFTKAYLSNIIGYDAFMKGEAEQVAYAEQLAAALEEPGMIYVSNGVTTFLHLSKKLRKDFALTDIARAEEAKRNEGSCLVWKPDVWRAA